MKRKARRWAGPFEWRVALFLLRRLVFVGLAALLVVVLARLLVLLARLLCLVLARLVLLRLGGRNIDTCHRIIFQNSDGKYFRSDHSIDYEVGYYKCTTCLCSRVPSRFQSRNHVSNGPHAHASQPIENVSQDGRRRAARRPQERARRQARRALRHRGGLQIAGARRRMAVRRTPALVQAQAQDADAEDVMRRR